MIIKKIATFSLLSILLVRVGGARAEGQPTRYFDVLLRGDEKNLKIINVDVVGSNSVPDLNESTGYSLEEVSFKGEVRDKKIFKPGLYSTHLQLPYNGDIEKIVVRNADGATLAEKKIGYFAQVCGDGTCQAHESYEICPQDCRSGGQDGYCDGVTDGICDADCQKYSDVDCALSSTSSVFSKSVVGLTIALFTITIGLLGWGGYAYYKKRKITQGSVIKKS